MQSLLKGQKKMVFFPPVFFWFSLMGESLEITDSNFPTKLGTVVIETMIRD